MLLVDTHNVPDWYTIMEDREELCDIKMYLGEFYYNLIHIQVHV